MNNDYTLRKAFWHLKKFSSYTWAAEIHRQFTRFVNDFEAWMRTNPPNASEIEEEVLRCVWYMQGKGEEGIETLINSEDKRRAYRLLSEGFDFEHFFWHDRWFTDKDPMTLEGIGFVSRRFEKPCTGIFNSLGAAADMLECYVAGAGLRTYKDIFPNYGRLPFWRTYGTPLWTPKEFPALPVSSDTITLLSGEEAPVTGIWLVEPISEDPISTEMLCVSEGRETYCLNFMRQGTVAPKMISEEEHLLVMEKDYRPIPADRTVRWRLLWKDERYGPNGIPDEEKDYLRIEEESSALPIPPKQDPGIQRCDGGKPCPRAGYWGVWHQPGSRRYFQTGEVMPSGMTTQGERIWYWDENQGA
jgi:hypothetical protein